MSTLKFDFDSIRLRLIDRLKAKNSWKDILYFGAQTRLIDSISEELSYDMQYDEFLSREIKWDTARQRSSLITEARFFNYSPYRKTGAFGNLKVGVDALFATTHPFTIEIPKYSLFSTASGVNFVCSETTSLVPGSASVDVPIVQGNPRTQTFSAVGIDYEKFLIDNASVENTIIEFANTKK